MIYDLVATLIILLKRYQNGEISINELLALTEEFHVLLKSYITIKDLFDPSIESEVK